jgi:ABC-type nickel/cobalt efflux system permease component RcnA
MSSMRALVLAAAMAVSLGVTSGAVQAQSEQALAKRPPVPAPHTRSVPEISAVGLGGVAVLLVGGVLLFGSRRKRRPTTD